MTNTPASTPLTLATLPTRTKNAADTRTGLTSVDAAQLLVRFGPNEIAHGQSASAWALAVTQFRSPLVLLLLGASVVAAALGEFVVIARAPPRGRPTSRGPNDHVPSSRTVSGGP